MKTKAVVFTEKNKVEIQDVALSDITDNDVLIDVEYSFISPGTERWCLGGQFHYGNKLNYSFPFVPGYQHAGRVKAIGKAVTSIKPGNRVFAPFNRFIGINSMWGGHCSMSVNAESDVIKLPDNVSSLEAAALVVAQVGCNGGSRPPVEAGNYAVVLGDGLIGQFVAQTLRNRGAYVIVAGCGDKKRLEYARKYSCDKTVNIAETDIRTEITKLAPNGVNIVVEATGLSENDNLALDLLAYNGHYVLNGFYSIEHRIDLNPFSLKEITVYNPASFTRPRLEETLNLIAAKKLDVKSLITHNIKSVNAAMIYDDIILAHKEFSLGIAIDWTDDKTYAY